MPVKSAKQLKFFQAIAHGMKSPIGPSREVAEKYLKETPSKKLMRKK